MSENKHTPEPWAYYDDRKSTGRIEIVGLGKTVSRIYLSVPDEDVANARRIVACVNACAGIPNEQLECDNLEFIRIFNEHNMLKKQRDELRAALENCRLLAARHRKEEWASHVLRFCGESGVAGEVMR